VVESEGRFLIGTRGPDGPLPGLAEFPGGKCEPGETPRDCALRECLEETGLRVEPVRLLEQCEFAYPHARVELHFWLCRPLVSSLVVPPPLEGNFQWVPRDHLPRLTFPDANRNLVTRICNGSLL